MILEQASDLGSSVPILRLGIPDNFVQHGSQKELRALLNLDAEGIYKQINNWLGRKNSLKVAV
jgi:1-deoxy-D-xylulose-5-phosphate synthase